MEHEMPLSTLQILFLHCMKNCYLQKAFTLFVQLSDAGSSSPKATRRFISPCKKRHRQTTTQETLYFFKESLRLFEITL